MLNSNTLGRAVGISQDEVSGNAGPNVPSINQNGVIVGRFKRGRSDKAFKVNSQNYKALLGEDRTNPSYTIVQDAFIAGASELWILRIGNPTLKLSNETEITDGKKFEQIAFESNLYPIPVIKDDIYKPLVKLLDVELRSLIKKAADVVDAYFPSINHFDIEKTTFGKAFDITEGYQTKIDPLHIHLGSVVKQPVPIVDGYQAGFEALSLSLRYGCKSFEYEYGYRASAKQLNIERISKIKEKEVGSRYTPQAEILDARLSQALQTHSLNIGTGFYTQTYTLLDLTISSGLVETAINTEGYQVQIEQLSLVLQQALSVVDIKVNSGYLPDIEALSVHLTDKGQYIALNDGYSADLEPMNIEYVSYLAGNYDANSGYLVGVEALDAAKVNFEQVDIEVSQDGYTPIIKPLDIFTTQRIK
ncbi:hypothetical protein [Psychrobacter sanguinis]|uniref:hypothetical protein n=1 Tax=Psychrobacter sanguinis TaxID=861445 RepID=UPI00191A0AEA|nr:hypothetical protein [Psychrobacter sanguinis]MCC3307527.1 hypothetical protein [Psychrobacter sanguinis]